MPTPNLAVYSSEPAGGQSQPAVLADIVRGQPLARPAYVILRWGVGAYQTALIADWPRQGGGFDVSGDNIEIDGLLTATTGPSLVFGAHLSPGNKSNPEAGTLTFTQQATNDTTVITMNVPSYASRVRLATTSTATLFGSWMDVSGATSGAFSMSSTAPYAGLVPGYAVALAFGGGTASGVVQAMWSLSP